MSRRERINHLLKGYGIVSVLLIAYYFWVIGTGLAILCPIHLSTGLLCPGCGVTRMLVALSRGEFSYAFSCNPALLLLAPLFLADIIWWHYLYIRYGEKKSRFHTVAIWIMIVSLLVFGVARNII
ncbi:MAG: DUF2752 domain-containing protein [Lachnospiraceae bacterium]|nr:DUF2752 domain-containing protein [Lachnospiraceae bacterium]